MSDVSSDSPEADAVSSHSESPPLARGDKWAYTEYGASPPGNGLSSRKANPQPPSTAVLADFEAEFHEFYTRAWAAGVRAKDLSQWAPKVAAAASEGEVKYILLNGCCESRLPNVHFASGAHVPALSQTAARSSTLNSVA